VTLANDRHVLSSERAPHINKLATVIKIWSSASDGCFNPMQTGRLAVGRNITLTLERDFDKTAQKQRNFHRPKRCYATTNERTTDWNIQSVVLVVRSLSAYSF
jgi:hypothetical protein